MTAHRAQAGQSCGTPSHVWRACCRRWVQGPRGLGFEGEGWCWSFSATSPLLRLGSGVIKVVAAGHGWDSITRVARVLLQLIVRVQGFVTW